MELGEKPRVLLVDDNHAVRKSYSLIFKALGWDVQEACDGEIAFDVACRENFDLAILDISMPGMDGIEFCGKLRRELPGRIGKILVISGVMDSATSELAAAEGADQVLKKPIGFVQLKETLSALGFGCN